MSLPTIDTLADAIKAAVTESAAIAAWVETTYGEEAALAWQEGLDEQNPPEISGPTVCLVELEETSLPMPRGCEVRWYAMLGCMIDDDAKTGDVWHGMRRVRTLRRLVAAALLAPGALTAQVTMQGADGYTAPPLFAAGLVGGIVQKG